MHGVEVKTPRRSSLAVDLSLLALVGVLLLAALGAGGAVLYNDFYGPSAFVTRYLDLLSSGRAADALRVPGVAVDREILADAGIAPTASEALLRQAALAPLTDIEVESEKPREGATEVTVSYRAAGHAGRTTFAVEQDGWEGVVPRWRFQRSPLAVVDLTLRGADRFAVNGFEMERAQVSAAGTGAADLDPLPMLVFTPGVYSVTVDTPISTAAGVGVLADSPLATTPLEVQTEPTEEFIDVVQKQVEDFLTACTTQEVLQPTACPFGMKVQNRITTLPTWSISQQPTVTVVPDGGDWRIPAAEGIAHVEVEIKSLFDGSIQEVSEDVPFRVDGSIVILADGTASIRVSSPDAVGG